MSEYSFRPHPEDPSLIAVDSRHHLIGDVGVSLTAKLQKLTRHKAKLQEKLATKEKEIQEWKEKCEKLNTSLAMAAFECTPEQTQKIADLSKTNRHLNSQLISSRNKVRELDAKVTALEKRLEEQQKVIESEQREEEEPASPTELQTLNDTLERSKKKLFEISNQNVQLKNELKMAHKCLQQELGVESVNLSQLLSGASSWRGRADQILMLQRKIAELREKLEGTDTESIDSSRSQPRHHLDSVRRAEIDALSKELAHCKAELEGVRQKVGGLKARNKILLDESNSYKLKTLELMEKSQNDDAYIKSLNEKISMGKFEYEHKLGELKKEQEHLQELKEETRLEKQKSQVEVENMAEMLNEKNRELESLTLANRELEENLRSVSGDFLFSCKDMSKRQFVELVQGLEEEKTSLVALVQSLNERLNAQIAQQSDQHDIIARQRVKISRIEAKVRQFESEKEEAMKKNRRKLRISEYSRSMCGLRQSTARSSESSYLSEIDRLKFRLEVATEKISYLEGKMNELNTDRNEDIQKFTEIIGRSKDFFQELFKNDSFEGGDESSCADSAVGGEKNPSAGKLSQ